MGSANGYVIDVEGCMVRAAWAAPFFALVFFNDSDEPCEPWLFHCETLDRAKACIRSRRDVLLDGDFVEIAR